MKLETFTTPSGLTFQLEYEQLYPSQASELKDWRKKVDELAKHLPVPEGFYDDLRATYVSPEIKNVVLLAAKYKKSARKITWEDLMFIRDKQWSVSGTSYSVEDIINSFYDIINPD